MKSRASPDQLELSGLMLREPKKAISQQKEFMKNLVRGKVSVLGNQKRGITSTE
jgi:hypothetical protein